MLVEWVMRMLEGSSSQQLYSADCLHKVWRWSSWTSSVSTNRHWLHRGWTFKGQKGYIHPPTEKFSMSFIIALSANRVYGIMGKDETVNYKVVRHFITWVLNYRMISSSAKISWCLVFDNASVQVWRNIFQFTQDQE